MRWIAALVIAGFVSLSAGTADAQAFKPRGAAKAPAKKTTKATAKKATKAPAKKAAKKSRAARSGSKARASDLTPDDDRSTAKGKAPEDADDYVLIEDD